MSGAAADNLVYRHQPDRKVPGVKIPGSMTFQELRRDKRTSTVKCLTRGTGRPALREAMFAISGVCDIARARGTRYFILLSESDLKKDGSTISVVGFSNNKNVDPQKYFGLKEPLELSDGEKRTFMAVKDFDLVFKGPQP
jgi:hypothetical protein